VKRFLPIERLLDIVIELTGILSPSLMCFGGFTCQRWSPNGISAIFVSFLNFVHLSKLIRAGTIFLDEQARSSKILVIEKASSNMPWTIDKNANANITQLVLFGARCGAGRQCVKEIIKLINLIKNQIMII
jgi:hypothetical protein